MKKALKLAGALLASALIVGFLSGRVYARLTGTDPGTDVVCFGISGAEVCVDVSGNLLPTTTNAQNLGSSSFQFNNAYIKTLNLGSGASTASGDYTVTGDLFKVPGATVTVTAAGNNPKIAVDNYCGGVMRLTGANADVTSAGFTTPAVATLGCILYVVNVGSSGGGKITFITSSSFIGPLTAGNNTEVILGTNDAVIIGQLSNAWYVLSTVVVNN